MGWTCTRTVDEIRAGMCLRQDHTEPGLAAYYPLDESSSNVARDASPRGLHGTLGGVFDWSQAGPPGITPLPAPEVSLTCNGADTFVTLPDLDDDFSNGFTFEIWAYMTEYIETLRGFSILEMALETTLFSSLAAEETTRSRRC